MSEQTAILIPDEAPSSVPSSVPSSPGSPTSGLLSRRTAEQMAPWDFVVLDRRATNVEEAKEAARWGMLIGLDEGGPAREFLPYLIDTLPRLGGGTANISSTSFLERPKRIRDRFRFPLVRVLFTFGGEDPAGLTVSMIRAVAGRRLFPGCDLTVVLGPAFASGLRSAVENAVRAAGRGRLINVIDSPNDLKERLHRYDLVVTSFGLTCFEALSAGVPVVLLNPTRYHHRLSVAAGIPEIGVGRPQTARLLRLITGAHGRRRLTEPVERYGHRPSGDDRSLSSWLLSLKTPEQGPGCPICTYPNAAVARFARRTYFRCRRCGLIYLLSFVAVSTRYDENYFEQEYRRQYGKTYLEDFKTIEAVSRGRLRIIERLVSGGKTSGLEGRDILDVGCAFGPFLKASAERGALPAGIDVFPRAVEYVRSELGLPCEPASFQEYEGSPVDVLTMWYVLEHLVPLRQVLAKAERLVRPGGIFAFSTPNAAGVSGRTDLRRFLERSPEDHLTVWTPGTARRILRRYGFSIERVRVTGHHPERFPWPGPSGPPAGMSPLLDRISRAAGLGDTFEVYARKVRSV